VFTIYIATMTEETLQNQVDEMRSLLDSQLRARGRSLDAQIRKAGRRLPRRIRNDAQVVMQAMSLIENPKLARMVDEEKIRKAGQAVIDHLKSIDPMDRFKGRILGMLGAISAVLIITFIITVYVLVNRGLV
jgi:hypothetical protein